MNAANDYKDIIFLPHHVSYSRKHMSRHDRAAQFAPFAALIGFEKAIDKSAGAYTDKFNRFFSTTDEIFEA